MNPHRALTCVWCLGIRSSGSTWVYNVVRKVAEVLLPGKPILGPYIVRAPDVPPLDDPSRLVIAKSHETDVAAATALAGNAHAIWISIRDPRDCVASLMQYHHLEFETALRHIASDATFCTQFTTHPRAHVLRYEAGFVDAIVTIDQIAGSLGGSLTASDRNRIFAETRRQAIEAFIRDLDKLPRALRPAPDDLVDPVTKWHNHHAERTGEVGRWRHALTPEQVVKIERRLGDWMNAVGYHPEVVVGQ